MPHNSYGNPLYLALNRSPDSAGKKRDLTPAIVSLRIYADLINGFLLRRDDVIIFSRCSLCPLWQESFSFLGAFAALRE
jgi:hypothetical protein